MSNKEYQSYVESKADKSPLALDMVKAFVIGGLICVIGQGVMEAAMSFGSLFGWDKPGADPKVYMQQPQQEQGGMTFA